VVKGDAIWFIWTKGAAASIKAFCANGLGSRYNHGYPRLSAENLAEISVRLSSRNRSFPPLMHILAYSYTVRQLPPASWLPAESEPEPDSSYFKVDARPAKALGLASLRLGPPTKWSN